MLEVPIVIIGAGPIGLALAGDLGFRGASCLLVERSDGGITQPKMDMIGIRTMEFCRRWGIVPWVESAGYNRAYPQDCAWVTSLNGHEFGREVFAAPKDEAYPPVSPQKRERCPQNFFDPVLRRFAEQFQTVEIRFTTELVSFVDKNDAVEVTLRDVASGEEYQVRTQYLIGADGGASAVRQTLGLVMTGEPALTYTTNVVFRAEGLEQLHDKKPGYRFIFIGPEGTWATLVAINGRDEWRFSLVGDQTRREVTEEEMRAAIIRAVGVPFEFEILSTLPWIRRQLVAEAYRKGRVFIAGDAAHLTSPTGGFGMNTGIQDAVNLSWKLSATLEGWGGPALLDSYEIEMRPIAIRNVAEATGNLKRMLSPQAVSPPKEIFEDGPGSEAARKQFGDHYTELMKREWFSIGIHLGYMFEGSPIIVPDGTRQPEDVVTSYTPTARPGSRAPHFWLSEGQSVLDLFGKEFVLLSFGEALDAAELVSALEERGVPVKLVTINDAVAAALYERKLVLVRPDGSVAWRADEVSASDALEIVETVRGARPLAKQAQGGQASERTAA